MAERTYRSAGDDKGPDSGREGIGSFGAEAVARSQAHVTGNRAKEGGRRMAGLKLPQGWVQGASKGEFFDREGNLRTAYGRRNELAREAGFTGYAEYRRVAADVRTAWQRLDFMAFHDVGRVDTLGPGSKFGQHLAKVRREAEMVKAGMIDRPGSRSALADFLVDLGRRDPEDDWAPGDTPGDR